MEYERLDVGFEKAFVVWDEPLREARVLRFWNDSAEPVFLYYYSTKGALRLSLGIYSHMLDVSFIF